MTAESTAGVTPLTTALDVPARPGGGTVSVIICAYTMQRWHHLVRAVDSVRRQTRPALEIILVVDHNDDLLRRAGELPDVRVVANTDRAGLSGARNTGVAASRGQVVAFLDDDAEASSSWLEHLMAVHDDPAVVGVGGWVSPEWQDRRPWWFPPEFLWVVGCSYTGLPAGVARIRNPIGANMAFRREAITSVGGFAVALGRVGTLPLGCEETELSVRVQDAFPGSVILLQPRAVVRHHVPRQRATATYFLRRCWSEGRSKAQVSRLVGSGPALSQERAYVRRTLVRGVLRAGYQGVTGKPRQVAVGLAIVAGLAVTAAGYGRGMLLARPVGATSGPAPIPGAGPSAPRPAEHHLGSPELVEEGSTP